MTNISIGKVNNRTLYSISKKWMSMVVLALVLYSPITYLSDHAILNEISYSLHLLLFFVSNLFYICGNIVVVILVEKASYQDDINLIGALILLLKKYKAIIITYLPLAIVYVVSAVYTMNLISIVLIFFIFVPQAIIVMNTSGKEALRYSAILVKDNIFTCIIVFCIYVLLKTMVGQLTIQSYMGVIIKHATNALIDILQVTWFTAFFIEHMEHLHKEV